jgi:hydroxymethylpyrimidine pyrophosphatase-like HAD family hydrolase
VSRVRLLALDDGTLLRSDKTISPRTRAAVASARAAGVRLVLVTGRRHPSARKVADDLGGLVPLVLHNGALVMEALEVVRVSPLPRAAARRAVLAGFGQGLEPVVHGGLRGEGTLVVREGARASPLVSTYLERNGPDVRVVPDLLHALAAEDPIQVMFGGPRAEMDAFLPVLAGALLGEARIERTVYPQNGLVLLDVIAFGVGKAEALAFLQERFGMDPRDTLAIGDNWNDREMLEEAGLGFVMGNADPDLHRLGLPVLPTNDEDGVAIAIEEHVLDR